MDREDTFLRELPAELDQARSLWGDGHHSTATRIAFEDHLFRLRKTARRLGLHRLTDLLSTLEAFVVSVPLDATEAEAAQPGIEAGLRLLDALRHPNVFAHGRAFEGLLARLSREIVARRQEPNPRYPRFEPPRKGR